jgi:pimeloyl-ACP methyl ester carboxylesterase
MVTRLLLRQRLFGAAIASCLILASNPVAAQRFSDIQVPATPLVLKSKGSFFVGGRAVERDFVELGSQRAADRVTVEQMYVEFMVPANAPKVPVVMVHGAGLSGQSFDTTVDGRMGWFEYFVRQSHPVFVVDQVGRARSGFDQAPFNRVGAGMDKPGTQPRITRIGDRIGAWVNFRFGPSPGVLYPGSQFPVDHVAELSRLGIPDLIGSVPKPNPSFKALSDLSKDIGGAVLLSHSQSGHFPLESALIDAAGIKGMVIVEPGTCGGSTWNDEQIGKLAKVPTLVVYGDNLSASTGLPGPGWQDRFADCQKYIDRINQAGGDASMLHPPDLGIHGNSHLLMQDRNNLQIADLILAWIEKNTSSHQP